MLHIETVDNGLSHTMSIFLILLIFILPLHAELKVHVTQGSAAPHPIAITEFQGIDEQFSQMGRELTHAMERNFQNAGVFNVINHKAFIQSSDRALEKPNFRDWRVIGARSLVVARVAPSMDGKTQVHYKLYSVLDQTLLDEQTISIDRGSWRRLGHIMSDMIYKKLTGDEGFFDSEITYIAEKRKGLGTIKQLALMDQDGQNHRFITMGKNIVLTPRFSPKGRVVAYLDYGITNKVPKVYILNLDTGSRTLLGKFPGMTYAPRFSPDGKKVIMSATNRNGDSHIFLMDVSSKEKIQLTHGGHIDTSPCFNPEGTQIAFHSDRDGTQQIYVMNIDGSNVRKISHGPGRYATPVWSPKGNYIAFTKIFDSEFHIGIMKSDGSAERLITNGYIVEDPVWSPNGRMMIFTRQWRSEQKGTNGKRRIHIIDLSGHNERTLPTPEGINAVTASWSSSRQYQ